MLKATKRYAMLLLSLMLMLTSMPSVMAAADDGKLVYEVTYAAEALSTPMDWYQSAYFDNPAYKENRFVQYWVETPIAPGGTRDTGFYIVYREDGVYMFFQSNEQERDADGVLRNSSIEFFVQTGRGDLPYHQMIVHTADDASTEYYEWQTEYRNNRPFKGNITLINEELPTGWGSLVIIPWEAVYDYVPLNGEDWEFSMIRWSPSHAPTWGGRVHQVGRFNVLDFQAPTEEQRTGIQKHVIRQAWDKFNATAAQLGATWLNGDADDERFYTSQVQPLIAAGQARGSDIPHLDSLSAAAIDELYQHVESWFELRYDVEDARAAYLKHKLFRDNAPPTVTEVTYATAKVNTPVSGIVIGTDPDGDALMYSLGTAAAHGIAAVDADGQWTYVPAEDYTGSDQFTVLVSDPSGATATATVKLTITAGPETTVALAPESPNDNGWFSSEVTVTLETSSSEVEVDRTEYRVNGGDWTVYSDPFTITEEGVHVLDYRSIDAAGIAEDVKSVTIQIDQTAPVIEVSLDKTVLSPPNRKMVPIEATIAHVDALSGIASFELTSITSNEEADGQGNGNTTEDIQDAEFGTPDTSFSLRAKRSGSGDGRVYTITYTVTDHAGNTATAAATVTVPKGNGG